MRNGFEKWVFLLNEGSEDLRVFENHVIKQLASERNFEKLVRWEKQKNRLEQFQRKVDNVSTKLLESEEKL